MLAFLPSRTWGYAATASGAAFNAARSTSRSALETVANSRGKVTAYGYDTAGNRERTTFTYDTDDLVADEIIVPIAAAFPVERIQEAVRPQAERHVYGKIVINL